MRKLPECRSCKFYADDELLVCALHPDGIAQGKGKLIAETLTNPLTDTIKTA